MKRRAFIALLGGAAAWPAAAWAQQPLPVVAYLDSRSSDGMAPRLAAFRHGLQAAGFADGETVRIEYWWSENRVNRVKEIAADLVRRQPAVIVTSGGPQAALAAKAATTTIPVVFLVGEDPTRLGLVASLSRPGGNLTGINLLANELEAKRLELLATVLPGATRVALLVNRVDATNTDTTLREINAAARAMGLQVRVFGVSTSGEIDEAFATIGRERPDALLVAAAAFLNSRRVQLAQLAAFHRLPATYPFREAAEVGGLMSYGPNIVDAYRELGVYTGRVLKGTRTADLPVLQTAKFELVINAATARMLGLVLPAALLATADEVLE
jgi:putative ABC transport system substrate-binding protein